MGPPGRRPGAVRAACGYYRALLQDRVDNLPWIDTPLPMPTLLVGAAEAYGAAWIDSMRDAAITPRSLLVDACGHYVPEEQPGVLAEALRGFFESSAQSFRLCG